MLFLLFENGLGDAAIALELYEQASDQGHHPSAPSMAIDPEADRAMKRQAWAAGAWPQTYLFRLQFCHAQMFVYALDQVAKGLGTLARHPLPSAISTVVTAQNTAWTVEPALADLKGVRDSSHHAEDRLRGRGRGNRQIQLQPINNAMVNAPHGGVLLAGNLNGNRFGWTMEDGRHGEVEVSAATLARARNLIQPVFDAPWTWSGPVEWLPR